MKNKDRKKQKSAKRAAERVAQILSDPTTPTILSDVLEDMICEVGSETNIALTTPEVARVALPLMFSAAEDAGLRQHNGDITREATSAAVGSNANN